MREVRIRLLPDHFDGHDWHYTEQPIVRLGDVGRWSMVRHVGYRSATPFVISRKAWDKLPLAEESHP